MSLHADSRISLRRNVSLSQYTTMQIGGPADWFAEPLNEEDLTAVLAHAKREGLPLQILGKGSNTIFPSSGYPGLVISLMQFQKNKIEFDKDLMLVSASSGAYLYKLCLACRDQGFGGAEFLASIPGTVGGAVAMNAGYSRHAGQKNEIADIVTEISAIDRDGKSYTLSKDDLSFGYRHSNIGNKIVTSVKFRLWHRKPEEIEAEIRACFDYRNAKQDLKHPSSGSIFKNPLAPSPAAARLIDELGLKGSRIGGMMVSPKHANYFVNTGNGTSDEMLELIHLIQEKVFHAKQIWLETEVRVVQRP